MVPIVHTPHGTGHARQTQPGGPGVVLLVAALASHAHRGGEEECEDNVDGDEDEHDGEHGAEVDTGEGAGYRSLKPAEQGGKYRVWRERTFTFYQKSKFLSTES